MILSINIHLIIALCIIVLLIVVFFVTYVYNQKIELPDDCKIEKCQGCSNSSCQFYNNK